VFRKVAPDQPVRPGQQLGVGAAGALLPGGQAGEHLVHPLGLLGPGELVGDEHDDPLAVPVRGHRAAPALATPHLHDRFPHPGHQRLAALRITFTLAR
jgi:hypothetical protein